MFGFCGRMRSNLAKFLLLHSLRTNLWSLYGFFFFSFFALVLLRNRNNSLLLTEPALTTTLPKRKQHVRLYLLNIHA